MIPGQRVKGDAEMSNRYMRASVTILTDPAGRRIALVAAYWPHADNDVRRWEAWDVDAMELGDPQIDELRYRVCEVWDFEQMSQVEVTEVAVPVALVAAGATS